MRLPALVTLVLMTFALLGCAETGRYPLSGEECGPADPVTGMTAPNCIPMI